MGYGALFLIGVGLSMDAFAASICKGLAMGRIRWRQGMVIALLFGAFQAGMPLVGWLLGTQFAALITPIDHWVAFGLLGVIGAKMVWDGLHEQPDDACPADEQALPVAELLMLGVATSIDAFAVGCTFAFLNVDIAVAVAVIGVATFALSLMGVGLGCKVGVRYNRVATVAGGVVLVLIGLKTLLEHLGIIA